MPLSEKARVEVYIPDLPLESYQNLVDAFEQEFTYSFGGCSILRSVDGSYLSHHGLPVYDRVNIVFTDLPVRFDHSLPAISQYIDALRSTAFQSLQEESILVVAFKVYHSE